MLYTVILFIFCSIRQMSPYLKNSRVRQVLADLALSQVSRWSVSRLSVSEYRRLVIGTQLIKDPGKFLVFRMERILN